MAAWKVGDLCEGQYSEDNEWYKARIEKVLSPGHYLVTYTEYGNQEETEDQFLRPLPGAAAAAPAPAAEPAAAPVAEPVAAPVAEPVAAPVAVVEATPVAVQAAAPASKWKVGDECEGQYSEDNEWYKARISEVLGEGRYVVTYTEYGNQEETEDQFLRPLAGSAATPAAAPVATASVTSVVTTAEPTAPAAEVDEWASSAPAIESSYSTDKPATDTLFVGGLSFKSTEESLANFFSQYGEIIGTRLATDRDTGKPKGFGYVQFAAIESATAAFAANGQDLDGRSIRLDYATSKQMPAGSLGPRGGASAGGSAGLGEKSNTDTIFVGSLPDEATEEDLRALGEPFGMVVSARIPRDRDTGLAKGIGYIQYDDATTTQAAYKGLYGAQLHGLSVRIDYARPSREFDPTKVPASAPTSNGSYSQAPVASSKLVIFDGDVNILARNRTITVQGNNIHVVRTFN